MNPIETLEIQTIESSQNFIDPLPDIFTYLEQEQPHKKQILQNIFNRLQIPFEDQNKFYVDLTIPLWGGSNVGGYYDTQNKYIAINPLILSIGDEVQIAHIIQHEYFHSIGITDESITELLTEEKMLAVYQRTGFTSGYIDLVEAIRPYFKQDLERIICELTQNPEANLDYIIEQVVLVPLLKEFQSFRSPSILDFQNIYRELNIKWDFLLKYFPRIFNQVSGNTEDMFSEAVMRIKEYNFERILHICAEFIFEDLQTLRIFIVEITKSNFPNIYDESTFYEALRKLGLTYIIDYSIENSLNPFELAFREQ